MFAPISECYKSEVDFFSTPETQTSIESNHYSRVNPLTAVTNDSAPIEFLINSSSEHFIDPSNIYLYTQFDIEYENGQDFPENQIVYPETNTLHTLFNSLEIYLNETKITNGGNNYSYRSFIETVLNHTKYEKKSRLKCQGFYSENERLKEIEKYSALKKISFEGYGKLSSEIFHQDKLLLNNCDIKIKLNRNKPEFVIKVGNDEAILNKRIIVNIKEIYMNIRRVKLTAHQQLSIEKMLNTTVATYPISRIEVKSFTLTKDISSKMISNIVGGKLPYRIIYGLTKHSSYNGLYKESGFCFNHFNLKSTTVYINGTPHTHNINVKYSDDENVKSFHTRAYHSLFSELNDNIDITYEDFKNTYCFYAFDLSQDRCLNLNDHINPSKQGELGIHLEFSKPISENLTLIIYLEFNNTIQIDKTRQIFIDY